MWRILGIGSIILAVIFGNWWFWKHKGNILAWFVGIADMFIGVGCFLYGLDMNSFLIMFGWLVWYGGFHLYAGVEEISIQEIVYKILKLNHYD
jgi:hypothetical protein